MVDTNQADGPEGFGPADDQLLLPDFPPPIESGETLASEVAPMTPPLPTPRRRLPLVRAIALATLAAIIGGGVATAVTLALTADDRGSNTAVVERVETQIVTPGTAGANAAVVAAKVLPSIVTVEVDLTGGGQFAADASGSGVVLDALGHLVTNHHVVVGGVNVRVVFADGRIYPASVIGSDPLTDLAVITIDATNLIPIQLGSTENMRIGDAAIAVGSPLGLEGGPSVTVGVLSAFNRRVQTGADEEFFGMLQTDAPITRGSSGGALVDSQGRLIGITSAIGVSDVGAEGLGFAIPVELVTRVAGELIDTGKVSHAFLGITGTTHFATLTDGALAPAGVEVATVMDGSAAALAGLQAGDVIVSLDGETISTMEGLVVRLRFHHVGDDVPMLISRSGAEFDLDITLMERPEGT